MRCHASDGHLKTASPTHQLESILLTTEEARNLLGRTALLRFCQPATVTEGAGEPCDAAGQFVQAFGEVDGRPTALTGRFLRANAFVSTARCTFNCTP